MIEGICRSLLTDWCHALRRLQIRDSGKRELDGAIFCPACSRIHGRCFEAMYPFLCLARSLEKDKRREWIDAADALFQWAEANVSQPDGAFLNDTDSNWKGTTVFSAIQLADCLWFHGEILPEETKAAWTRRLRKAADFLCDFDGLRDNNINYPVSNALALLECGIVLKESYYEERAKEWIAYARTMITENGLIYGEGVPREQKSPAGCVPVDIGYNVEETLPSMALYGWLAQEKEIMRLAEESLASHLDFMLEDGGWDNCFGTRNFKWTYWGSRTSDGCGAAYLLYRDGHPEFVEAARKNLDLMRKCTIDGLLAGGPHYGAAGQKICAHHTFTHGKVAAGILDRRLYECQRSEKGRLDEAELPRQSGTGIRYYKEINTWIINRKTITATVTAYDWEYLPGGHVSGGTLALLFHTKAGILFCSGMGEYSRKEPANMQAPADVIHECLALRIEEERDGVRYSSIYEDQAVVTVSGDWVFAKGVLKDKDHCAGKGKAASYGFGYRIRENGFDLEAEFQGGSLICPIISRNGEEICFQGAEGGITQSKEGISFFINREECKIRVQADHKLTLPYGTERIFNLVPGLQAIKLEGKPADGRIHIRIDILPH